MEKSGYLSALAAVPRRKWATICFEQKAGCAPEPGWVLYGTENLLAPARIQTPGHPVRSQVTILTELTQN